MAAIKKKRKAFVDQEGIALLADVVLRFAPLGQFKSGKVWLHR